MFSKSGDNLSIEHFQAILKSKVKAKGQKDNSQVIIYVEKAMERGKNVMKRLIILIPCKHK